MVCWVTHLLGSSLAINLSSKNVKIGNNSEVQIINNKSTQGKIIIKYTIVSESRRGQLKHVKCMFLLHSVITCVALTLNIADCTSLTARLASWKHINLCRLSGNV